MRGFRNAFAGLLRIYLREGEREKESVNGETASFSLRRVIYFRLIMSAEGVEASFNFDPAGIFFPPTSGSFDQETMN